MKRVVLGYGNVIVTEGRVEESEGTVVGVFLSFEPNEPGHEIGETSTDHRGELAEFTDESVVLEFRDPRSIDVVIEQLQTAKEHLLPETVH